MTFFYMLEKISTAVVTASNIVKDLSWIKIKFIWLFDENQSDNYRSNVQGPQSIDLLQELLI